MRRLPLRNLQLRSKLLLRKHLWLRERMQLLKRRPDNKRPFLRKQPFVFLIVSRNVSVSNNDNSQRRC